MKSNEKYSCVRIEAESEEGFQEYVYENGKVVPSGTTIGVEITQFGKTELFLYDGIYFSNNPRKD